MLKRCILIAFAGVLFVVAMLLLGVFLNYYHYVYVNAVPLSEAPSRFEIYPWLFVSLDAAMMTFSAICSLAAVDMLACVEQKKYSMKMFGIGIALLTLTVVRVIFVPYVINFACNVPYKMKIDNSYKTLLVYSLGQGIYLCGFLGLAIAYVCAKKKYLKSLLNE